MSEWGIALIAAGSAVAGSIVTGWFTRSAGQRQAAAAKHAGDRQADALLTTVQATLQDQRRARAADRRRQIYLELAEAAHLVLVQRRTGPEDLARLTHASWAIGLVGPQSVDDAASELCMEALSFTGDSASIDEERLSNLYYAFQEAARQALDEAEP
ncbi:hypothetical protein AB0D78_08305 [Streptomyces avermitilis]|uniref:hypothetical protein n=1 Tax=Streptomyces avermitilis TaxID=33903 RepID=UPI0033D83720